MDPAVSRTLAALHDAHRSGDLVAVAACYVPEAVLRAPFLTEPLRGWKAIETHLATVVFPHFHGLEVLETRDEGGHITRTWRAFVKDREGLNLAVEGESRYAFNEAGQITEVSFHLDEANLRLLVLRRG